MINSVFEMQYDGQEEKDSLSKFCGTCGREKPNVVGGSIKNVTSQRGKNAHPLLSIPNQLGEWIVCWYVLVMYH